MYDNLSVGASLRLAVCGEGDLAGPVKRLLKWGGQTDLNRPSGLPNWVFAAPFYPARLIDDPRYTKAVASRRNGEQLAATSIAYGGRNISYKDKLITKILMGLNDFDNFRYVMRHNIVELATTCNIEAREQLFADYVK